MSDGSGEIHVSIGGNVEGQLGIGRGITQITRTEVRQALDPGTVARARQGLSEVRDRVRDEAPPEVADEALARLDEFESSLGQAVDADELDPEDDTGLPGRMDQVRNWFLEHLPSVAGEVSSLVVHPIVGRLVEVVGDGAAKALSRRFGLDSVER